MRKNNLDYLKVLAIFCVIAIHVYDKLISSYHSLTIDEWNTTKQIESIIRMAVPIFFMVNGLLVLKKQEGEKAIVFYKKTFPKILIPYILFTVIYMYASSQWFNEPFTIGYVMKGLFNFSGFYHLWFIKALLGIYLLVPAMRLMLRFINRAQTEYILDAFMLGWFIISIVLPFFSLKVAVPEIMISSPFFASIFPYIGYFVLGYYLEYRVKPLVKFHKPTIFISAVIAFAGMVLTSTLSQYLLNLETMIVNPYVFYPQSMNIFLTSTGITFIFLLLEDKMEPNAVVKFISNNTLLMYFIHPLIISYLTLDLGIDMFYTQPLSQAAMVFVITSILVLGITLIWHVVKLIALKLFSVSKLYK